jgi:hypothetical protein
MYLDLEVKIRTVFFFFIGGQLARGSIPIWRAKQLTIVVELGDIQRFSQLY